MQILCQILDHKPDKKHVWHDGLDFRCPCKRCGLPMIRDLEGWRPFDSETDLSGAGEDRVSRPDHGTHGRRVASR